MSDPLPGARRASAGPFLKWAGGKTQLLGALERFFPAEVPEYVEPFVGSGAVFFHLRARGRLTGAVTLADVNAELVNAFAVVRDRVDDLLSELVVHKTGHGREH